MAKTPSSHATPSGIIMQMEEKPWTILKSLPRHLAASGSEFYWAKVFTEIGWLEPHNNRRTEFGEGCFKLGPGKITLRQVLDLCPKSVIRSEQGFLSPYGLVVRNHEGMYKIKTGKTRTAIQAYLNGDPDMWDIL